MALLLLRFVNGLVDALTNLSLGHVLVGLCAAAVPTMVLGAIAGVAKVRRRTYLGAPILQRDLEVVRRGTSQVCGCLQWHQVELHPNLALVTGTFLTIPAELGQLGQILIDGAASAAGRNPSEIRRLYHVVGSIGPRRGGQGLNGPVELWIETFASSGQKTNVSRPRSVAHAVKLLLL
jgi:hypothetical protein